MSRSRKKTPIGSWACVKAGEEKLFKRKANKSFRRLVKIKVRSFDDPEPLPHRLDVGNVWAWPKDGKGYFDPKKHPKSMRK